MPLSKGGSELTAETSDPIGVRDLLHPAGPPFVRPRCTPRITKEHSAAACAAAAQSSPAALNGYDSTTLFHHAIYAASYTACLSNMASEDTSYVRLRPDKTAPGHV